MSREHSFSITISNNKTEKQGIEFLRALDPRFVLLDKIGRTTVMERLGIPKKYSRTFDLIYVNGNRLSAQEDAVTVRSPGSIDVIEVKTTRKRLPNFPVGFFFGATENEFELAELLGTRYKFCLVSLHPDSKKEVRLTLPELNAMIRTKRIQYQINL